MRKSFSLVVLALLLLSLQTLVYVTMQGYIYLDILGNLFICSISLCAMVACWIPYRKLSKNFPLEKKGWFFIALATTLFFLGDIAWAFFEVFLKIHVPVGSLCDLFWNLAYFSLMYGLWCLMSVLFFESQNRNRIILFASFLIGCVVLFFDLRVHSANLSFVDFIQHLYVFYDVIILGMIYLILMPLLMAHNHLFITWTIFGSAIIARIVFDFIFAHMNDAGTFYTGHPLDLVYTFSYFLFVFAAYEKDKLIGIITMREKA
ncbi:Uncharacterised protein [uncultured archaeon]|nr:Uncharacterised protein [uncultured archaeon]